MKILTPVQSEELKFSSIFYRALPHYFFQALRNRLHDFVAWKKNIESAGRKFDPYVAAQEFGGAVINPKTRLDRASQPAFTARKQNEGNAFHRSQQLLSYATKGSESESDTENSKYPACLLIS